MVRLSNNVPLNQINVNLEKHKPNPYSLSAGENAALEETYARQWNEHEVRRVDGFLQKTMGNIKKKQDEDAKQSALRNQETVRTLKLILLGEKN
jgi:hypothetical protein